MRQRQHREGHKVIVHVDLERGAGLSGLAIELDEPVTLQPGERLLVELCVPHYYNEIVGPEIGQPTVITRITL